MIVQDLGQLRGPILLFGGPYSNLQALTALRAGAQELGIPNSNMICTGDVVAYCASPIETIAMIRDLGCTVVAGNCEKQLGEGRDNCGCGFEEGSSCDVLSVGWFAHASKQVGKDDRAWMRSLPDVVTFTLEGLRYAVIHGGLTDISRFVWATSAEKTFEEEIVEIIRAVGDVDAVIAGHSGIAFQRQILGVTWINAGVIGMPHHAGTPETQFVVLDGGQAHVRGLRYDSGAAHDAMLAAGLTQGYHTALLSGYWPSEDVLPPELRRAAMAKG
ncbi:Calcineurin-like phosphoesterase superfamily domain protein [Roseovarius albus]|uniref:Calcineurin-like phosphoesterase superfamily domain protein n=1 Tax=Roseovarius albus TaxID=1247867 RepID=A0A1X6ZI47_9RHOB|nr:metallophosphoesterase family protein [Roseovarius albus]SLN50362.1 Calcineurin-like phosphoesterase superfamily domain protein [Roseovarius albus]